MLDLNDMREWLWLSEIVTVCDSASRVCLSSGSLSARSRTSELILESCFKTCLGRTYTCICFAEYSRACVNELKVKRNCLYTWVKSEEVREVWSCLGRQHGVSHFLPTEQLYLTAYLQYLH